MEVQPVHVFFGNTGTVYEVVINPSQTTVLELKQHLEGPTQTKAQDLTILLERPGKAATVLKDRDTLGSRNFLDASTFGADMSDIGVAGNASNANNTGCDDTGEAGAHGDLSEGEIACGGRMYAYDKKAWDQPPAPPVPAPEGDEIAAAGDDGRQDEVKNPHAEVDPGQSLILGALLTSEARLFRSLASLSALSRLASAECGAIENHCNECDVCLGALAAALSYFRRISTDFRRDCTGFFERNARVERRQKKKLEELKGDLQALSRIVLPGEVVAAVMTVATGGFLAQQQQQQQQQQNGGEGGGAGDESALVRKSSMDPITAAAAITAASDPADSAAPAGGGDTLGAGGTDGSGGDAGGSTALQLPRTLLDLMDIPRLERFTADVVQAREMVTSKVSEVTQSFHEVGAECESILEEHLSVSSVAAVLRANPPAAASPQGTTSSLTGSEFVDAIFGDFSASGNEDVSALVDEVFTLAQRVRVAAEARFEAAGREAEHLKGLVDEFLRTDGDVQLRSSTGSSVDAAVEAVCTVGPVSKDADLAQIRSLARGMARIHWGVRAAMYATMARIARASYRVRKTEELISLYRRTRDRVAKDFRMIEAVSEMPAAYARFEREVLRRLKFASEYATYYAKIAHKMAKHHASECAKRDEFDKECGTRLPPPLARIMCERPPRYELDMPHFDVLLPRGGVTMGQQQQQQQQQQQGAGAGAGAGADGGREDDESMRQRATSEPDRLSAMVSAANLARSSSNPRFASAVASAAAAAIGLGPQGILGQQPMSPRGPETSSGFASGLASVFGDASALGSASAHNTPRHHHRHHHQQQQQQQQLSGARNNQDGPGNSTLAQSVTSTQSRASAMQAELERMAAQLKAEREKVARLEEAAKAAVEETAGDTAAETAVETAAETAAEEAPEASTPNPRDESDAQEEKDARAARAAADAEAKQIAEVEEASRREELDRARRAADAAEATAEDLERRLAIADARAMELSAELEAQREQGRHAENAASKAAEAQESISEHNRHLADVLRKVQACLTPPAAAIPDAASGGGGGGGGMAATAPIVREEDIPAAIGELASRAAALDAHTKELEQELERCKNEVAAADLRAQEADRALCEAGAIVSPAAAADGKVDKGKGPVEGSLIADPAQSSTSSASSPAPSSTSTSAAAQAPPYSSSSSSSSASSSSSSSLSSSSTASGSSAGASAAPPLTVAVDGLDDFGVRQGVTRVAFVRQAFPKTGPASSQQLTPSMDNAPASPSASAQDGSVASNAPGTPVAPAAQGGTNPASSTPASVSSSGFSGGGGDAAGSVAAQQVGYRYEALTMSGTYFLEAGCLRDWGLGDLATAPRVLLGTVVFIQEAVVGEEDVQSGDYGIAKGTKVHLITAEHQRTATPSQN